MTNETQGFNLFHAHGQMPHPMTHLTHSRYVAGWRVNQESSTTIMQQQGQPHMGTTKITQAVLKGKLLGSITKLSLRSNGWNCYCGVGGPAPEYLQWAALTTFGRKVWTKGDWFEALSTKMTHSWQLSVVLQESHTGNSQLRETYKSSG